MKKLSFLLPSYNIKKYLISNFSMWKKLSQIVELIFVEDTEEPELRELAGEIGGHYYSKSNGNWGSVINYARNNRIINTEYMAIVDPDDTIIISELEILISKLEDKDLYITNYNKIFYESKKTEIELIELGETFPFIHSLWMRTDVFYKTARLPEGFFFTDINFTIDLVSLVKTWAKIELSPYNWFLELQGQSSEMTFDSFENKIKSLNELSKLDGWMKKNGIRKNKEFIKKYDQKYTRYLFIRNLYDQTARKNFKALKFIYKNEMKGHKPFKLMLIWSRIFRVFIR